TVGLPAVHPHVVGEGSGPAPLHHRGEVSSAERRTSRATKPRTRRPSAAYPAARISIRMPRSRPAAGQPPPVDGAPALLPVSAAMPVDLRSLLDPTHAALLTMECQEAIIGDRALLPA